MRQVRVSRDAGRHGDGDGRMVFSAALHIGGDMSLPFAQQIGSAVTEVAQLARVCRQVIALPQPGRLGVHPLVGPLDRTDHIRHAFHVNNAVSRRGGSLAEQVVAQVALGRGNAESCQHRRRDVDIRHDIAHTAARQPRHFDEQRNPNRLVVQGSAVNGAAVLEELFAVVCAKHNDGRCGTRQGVDDFAKLLIGPPHFAGVTTVWRATGAQTRGRSVRIVRLVQVHPQEPSLLGKAGAQGLELRHDLGGVIVELNALEAVVLQVDEQPDVVRHQGDGHEPVVLDRIHESVEGRAILEVVIRLEQRA